MPYSISTLFRVRRARAGCGGGHLAELTILPHLPARRLPLQMHQYIAAVTKGPARYESFTFRDVKVKLYGKAAVLTGFVDVKMVGQDAFRVRTLQVYTEDNGQWQMAAHQSTRLAR